MWAKTSGYTLLKLIITCTWPSPNCMNKCHSQPQWLMWNILFKWSCNKGQLVIHSLHVLPKTKNEFKKEWDTTHRAWIHTTHCPLCHVSSVPYWSRSWFWAKECIYMIQYIPPTGAMWTMSLTASKWMIDPISIYDIPRMDNKNTLTVPPSSWELLKTEQRKEFAFYTSMSIFTNKSHVIPAEIAALPACTAKEREETGSILCAVYWRMHQLCQSFILSRWILPL